MPPTAAHRSHSSLPTPGEGCPAAAGVSVPTSHLFPIDVAGGYGDHGGFSHKSREEGAHAQGGSVDPGDEKAKAISLLNPCGGTPSVKIQPTPRKGVDKRHQTIAFRVCT